MGARVKLQQHYLSLQLFINITVIKYTTTTITALSKTHKNMGRVCGPDGSPSTTKNRNDGGGGGGGGGKVIS